MLRSGIYLSSKCGLMTSTHIQEFHTHIWEMLSPIHILEQRGKKLWVDGWIETRKQRTEEWNENDEASPYRTSLSFMKWNT